MAIYDKRKMEAYRQSVKKANETEMSEEEKRKNTLKKMFAYNHGLDIKPKDEERTK